MNLKLGQQKKCLIQLNLQDEIFLKSRVHCIKNSLIMKVYFPFLNWEMFDLRKIYVLNLKNGRSKKMPYVDWICNMRSFLNQEFTVLLKEGYQPIMGRGYSWSRDSNEWVAKELKFSLWFAITSHRP
jgi:hypothetical protein